VRTVLQRVERAEVRVDGESVGAIARGLLLLVGIERGDTLDDVAASVAKIARLRCFPGRTPMDRTVAEVGGGCLVVSQFTLAADLARGNRPSFDRAERPERAVELVDAFVAGLQREGIPVATGRFGASMAVELVNDGPVTFVVDVVGGKVRSAARPEEST
jgi:D-tyrosyl-tRNA(Tyr) deacylase